VNVGAIGVLEQMDGEDHPKVPWEDCTDPSQTATVELYGPLRSFEYAGIGEIVAHVVK
jgi:hypothetical protein